MYDFDPKKDYYKVLGIDENASADEIKKAFKKLAVKHHPDKEGGNKQKFQEANEAFQVLSDEKKRQQYDMMRKGGYSGEGFDFGGFQGGGFQGGNFDFGGFDLGDIVGNIFGGGFGGAGRSQRPAKGDDIKHELDISFEESFLGTEKKISYTRYIIAEGATKETCTSCGGKGSKVQQVQTPFGVMQTQAACNVCQGVGTIYKKDGKELPHGGLEQHKDIITVKVPSGIKSGVYIKFEGKGHAGIGGTPAGDLYIKISVKHSSLYERKGNDLYTKCKLSVYDLVLGATVDVNHPEGKISVKIPKGTQVGDLIKVSGKGFGEGGIFGSKGNLYLEPEISIPKKLSKEEEKLWQELREVTK